MEFIRAFAEAKKLGLSKEELITMWEIEAQMKLKAEEAKVLHLQQNKVPVKSNHHHESTFESVLDNQTENLINEVKQLNNRLDFMEVSLISNFEQQKQQIQEETGEVRQQFQCLGDLLEDCMRALKVSVAEADNEGRSNTLGSQQHKVKLREQSRGSSFEVTSGDIPDTSANYANLTGVSRSQTQQISSKKGGAIINEHQELNLTNKGASMWNLDAQPWKLDGQNNNDDMGESADSHLQQSCLVGTRNFTNVTSSIMPRNMKAQEHNSSQDNAKTIPSYIREVLKVDRKRYRNTGKTNLSIICCPQNDGECFCIPNFHVFQRTSEDFFTESVYTRPKACKVRLRLRFTLDRRLQVRLLVSQGGFEESNQWPMIFNGNGYIFNPHSGTYTRLWVIESQVCSMPEKNKEIAIRVTVCLNTSRNAYDDVTSNLLIEKGYVADDDCLRFRWSVSATERQSKSPSYWPFPAV